MTVARTHKRMEPRDQVIVVQATRSQRATIDQAGLLVGKRRSDFILGALVRAAKELLPDRVSLHLDPESIDRFVALLDEPPPPTDALRNLLTRSAPWE
jgi:uncharacterized protein (DUF1778 family)